MAQTVVWTAEGWLYVAAVLDLFSRKVVGWSKSAQLVIDALMMAVWRRGKPVGAAASFRPGQPVYERGLPAPARRSGHPLQHEPPGRLLRQCGDGELLLYGQARKNESKAVCNA